MVAGTATSGLNLGVFPLDADFSNGHELSFMADREQLRHIIKRALPLDYEEHLHPQRPFPAEHQPGQRVCEVCRIKGLVLNQAIYQSVNGLVLVHVPDAEQPQGEFGPASNDTDVNLCLDEVLAKDDLIRDKTCIVWLQLVSNTVDFILPGFVSDPFRYVFHRTASQV